MTITLNTDQESAVAAMRDFISSPAPFFLLSGPAGTGKTTCIKHLLNHIKGKLVFTAPTNKATKVLFDIIADDHYKPVCRTIYSLLGLKLEPNGEVKELAVPEDPVDLSSYTAIIVDESSMLNSTLFSYIIHRAEVQDLKFIFMGDRYQLPPVGEPVSPVWKEEMPTASLTKVERHDNQILEFVTYLRDAQTRFTPTLKIAGNNSDGEGIWAHRNPSTFRRALIAAAPSFAKANESKIIAWRNVTVDAYNTIIREALFNEAAQAPWLPTDRIILTAPHKDLEGNIGATTDSEGIIDSVVVCPHPSYPAYQVHQLSVTLDSNEKVTLYALSRESLPYFNAELSELAARARGSSRVWKDYWALKDAFTSLRHAYAITAHRAQGSSYQSAYVDWADILRNKDRMEALKCLYVAASRARKQLILA